MEGLPIELVELILARLEAKALASCEGVCSAWRAIIVDKCLWKALCLHDFHAFIETRPAHPSYLEPAHYGAVTVDTLLWHPPSGQIEAEEGEQLEGLEPKFAVSPWGPDANWKVQYGNCSKASARCLTGCWVSTLNSQSELLEVQQYGYEVQATTPLDLARKEEKRLRARMDVTGSKGRGKVKVALGDVENWVDAFLEVHNKDSFALTWYMSDLHRPFSCSFARTP